MKLYSPFLLIHRMSMEVKARELKWKPKYFRHVPTCVLSFVLKIVGY